MALRHGLNQLFGRYLLVTNTVSCAALMGLGDATVQGIERLRGEKKPYDWARTGRMTLIGSVFGPIDHAWYIYLERAFPGTRVITIVKKILIEQVFLSPVTYYIFFVGRLSTLGLVMGPFNHGWYCFLDKILPGVTVMVVTRKILSDQIVAAPFFAFTFFIESVAMCNTVYAFVSDDGCVWKPNALCSTFGLTEKAIILPHMNPEHSRSINSSGILEGQSIKTSKEEFKNKFWEVYKADWMVWPAAQAVNFYFLHPKYRVVYVAVITFGWNTFLSYIKHRDEAQRKCKVQLDNDAS